MDSDKLADLGNRVVDLGSAAVQQAVTEFTIYYERMAVFCLSGACVALLFFLLILFVLMPRAARKHKEGATVSDWITNDHGNDGPKVVFHIVALAVSGILFFVLLVNGVNYRANPKAAAISKVCNLIKGR